MNNPSNRSSSPHLASRLALLGTETAYEISAEAKALADAGWTIYSFHIGDENFGTARSVTDGCIAALEGGKTTYPPAAGVASVGCGKWCDCGF